MKKTLLSCVLSLALASSLSAQTHEHHHANSQEQQVLMKMHEAMMQTPFVESGIVEKDFLANMIPHHQGAIDSAKFLLNNNLASNEKLRQIAKNIIATQEKEIAEFNTLLSAKTYEKSKISTEKYEEFLSEEKQITDAMHGAMSSVKTNANPQKSFALAMISHHQGAIDLSKQILKYSNDKKISQIAKDIITAQEKEIAEFQALLKEL